MVRIYGLFVLGVVSITLLARFGPPRDTETPPPVPIRAVQEVLDASVAPPADLRVTLAHWLPAAGPSSCPCGDGCNCDAADGCRCADRKHRRQPASAKKRLLAFSAPTSPACLRMKRDIEARPELQQAILGLYTVTRHDEPRGKDREAFQQYKIRGVPACVMLDEQGKEIKRFNGYKSPAELARWLGVGPPCPPGPAP